MIKSEFTFRWIILLPIISAIFISSCTSRITTEERIKQKRAIRNSQELSISPVWEDRIKAIKLTSVFCDDNPEEKDRIILKALNDIHPAVRIEALACIMKKPSQYYLPHIKKIAEEDNNSNVRWFALQALSEYRLPELAEIFKENFKSEDWVIRKTSIIGLLSINDTQIQYNSVDTITKSLKDSSTAVITASLENLTIKHKKLYDEIVILFQINYKKSKTITNSCLKALSGYELDEKTREMIIQLLTDLNSQTRILAYRVLKKEQMMKEIKTKFGEQEVPQKQ